MYLWQISIYIFRLNKWVYIRPFLQSVPSFMLSPFLSILSRCVLFCSFLFLRVIFRPFVSLCVPSCHSPSLSLLVPTYPFPFLIGPFHSSFSISIPSFPSPFLMFPFRSFLSVFLLVLLHCSSSFLVVPFTFFMFLSVILIFHSSFIRS